MLKLFILNYKVLLNKENNNSCYIKSSLGEWSGKRDSNSRPSRWQRDALPLSYSR